MTIATKLTLLRIVVVPLFLVSFLWHPVGKSLSGDWGKVAAAIIFIFAAITDYYDGHLARLYKEETTLGKFMDPIADKILVSTALIAMTEYRSITFLPAWVAAVIVAREFAVTGMRLVCTQQGTVVAASDIGKWKTTAQLTAIITCLVFLAAQVFLDYWQVTASVPWFFAYHGHVLQVLYYLAALITVYSGYDYLKTHWHLLDE